MATYKNGFTTYEAFSAVERQVKKDFAEQGWKLESVSLYDYYTHDGAIKGATVHVSLLAWWSNKPINKSAQSNENDRKEYDYMVAIGEDNKLVVERSDYDYNNKEDKADE